MTIIGLIIILIILGIIFAVAEQIPMAAPYPMIVRAVAVIVALLVILQFLGVNTGLPTLH